jgi:hypothetical protein
MTKTIVGKVLMLVALVLILATPVLAKGNAQVEVPPVTAENITLLLIGGLSLLLDYFPGIAGKWDALDESKKKLTFLVAATVIVVGAFVLKCNGVIDTDLVCSEVGAWNLITDVLYVFAIGTGFHVGTKPTEALQKKMFAK